LSPDDVFDILTDNGEIQGLYKVNNKIYFNAEYIQAGVFLVRDKNNNIIFKADLENKTVQLNGDYVSIGGMTLPTAITNARSGAVSDMNTRLTPDDVFRRLTNDGEVQGLTKVGSQVYINATYIHSGTLKLGGYGNENGLLQILDANNNEIGTWNKDGISIRKGSLNLGNGQFTVSNTGALVAKDGAFSGSVSSSTISASTITGSKVTSQSSTRKIEMDASYLRFEDTEAKTKSAASGWDVDPTAGWITTRNQNATYYNAEDGSWEYFVGQYVPCLDILARNGSDLRIAMASSPTAITRQVITVHGTDNGRVGFGTPVNMASGLTVAGNVLCTNLIASSSVTARGSKPRAVDTEDYGTRLLYCYETPTPVFGDIGEGKIGEDGACYVPIDPVFAETVTLNSYQVFLQLYGEGNCYVSERKPGYFIVTGTPGLSFGWELKARQKDFDQLRLKDFNMMLDEAEPKGSLDYGELGMKHIEQIANERSAA